MDARKYKLTIEQSGQVRRYGPTIRVGIIHTDDPEAEVKAWIMELENIPEKPDWWNTKLEYFKRVDGGYKFKTFREYLD